MYRKREREREREREIERGGTEGDRGRRRIEKKPCKEILEIIDRISFSRPYDLR